MAGADASGKGFGKAPGAERNLRFPLDKVGVRG